MRQFAAAWVICLLASGVAAEPAPGQSPSALQSAQPQSDPGGDKTAAQPQSPAPAPIIVNVHPPAHTDAETKQEEAERKEKANSDRRLVELTGDLAYYTKLLAWATIVLTIATAGLFAFAVLQARDAREVGKSAKKSAKAARRSANLAEAALMIAEAPYLVPIVRAFDSAVDPQPPSPAMIPLVSLRFENCGRSPATVLEIHYRTLASETIPDPAVFPPPQINAIGSYILAQNRESNPVRLTVNGFGGWTPTDQSKVAWIVGHLRYGDVFGNQFLTGFCFTRNARSKVWFAQGGPLYNYRRRFKADELSIARTRDSSLHGVPTIGLIPDYETG